MQCSAMSLKLKNQFTAAFAVDSLFPFFVNRTFPFAGKIFFLPVNRKTAANRIRSGGDCDAACKRREHRGETA